MSGVVCARCELAILGLAICTIAAVVALVRSREVLELRIAAARAQWEEAMVPLGARLAACEAQLAGRIAGTPATLQEPEDQELASWLESLRDLASSLQASKHSVLNMVNDPASARKSGGGSTKQALHPDAELQDRT